MKILRVFGLKSIWSMPVVFLVVFIVIFSALLLLPHKVSAADAGEYVYFRIDTELNVLNAKGVTVEWSCNGTASGSIIETAGGIASESAAGIGQAIDGIVNVASASKEMTDSTCAFGASQTIRAKVSLDGWITRKWNASLPASASAAPTTWVIFLTCSREARLGTTPPNFACSFI